MVKAEIKTRRRSLRGIDRLSGPRTGVCPSLAIRYASERAKSIGIDSTPIDVRVKNTDEEARPPARTHISRVHNLRVHRGGVNEWRDGYTRVTKVVEGVGPGSELPLGLFEVIIPATGRVPPHVHRVGTEIFYAFDNCTFTITSVAYPILPGDVLVVRPGESHSIAGAGKDCRLLALRVPFLPTDKYPVR